jgi:glycosyl transferase, family 25
MKTYAISLKRSKDRYQHIQNHLSELKLNFELIPAIDGNELTEEDIKLFCDEESVEKMRWWLTNGAIGCSLSHMLACKMFLKTSCKSAFIVEDDVVLPDDIQEVLKDLSKEIRSDEIILLYYTSSIKTYISTKGAVNIDKSKLYYPIDIEKTMAATAYLLGREAAEGLIRVNTPVKVTADCWHYFYKQKAFNYLRLLYPSTVSTKNLKSSIDYFEKKSLKGIVSNIIDKYKIPFLFQFFKKRRLKLMNDYLSNFELSDEISPLYKREL